MILVSANRTSAKFLRVGVVRRGEQMQELDRMLVLFQVNLISDLAAELNRF